MRFGMLWLWYFFKSNDAASEKDVQISNVFIVCKNSAIFCQKCWELCSAKASHIFSAKTIVAIDFMITRRLNPLSAKQKLQQTTF